MELVEGLVSLRPEHGRLFVVIGVFDGIHRGHAYLLRRLVAEARRLGARPAVITFDSHPDEILLGSAPPLLVDPDERIARLGAAGVDVTVVQHFDQALRETTYDAFVDAIRQRVELAGFLMTPDAAFGYERAGTPSALAALGRASARPFEVVTVAPYSLQGRAVRSSDIRAAIAAGSLDDARRLLGRAHAVVGLCGGDGIVRPPMPVALPPDGAYRVRVGPPLVDGRARGASIGVAVVEGGTVRVAGRSGRRRVAMLGSATEP